MKREVIGDGIAFTLEGFLTGDQCRAWIDRSEGLGYESNAPITTTGGFEKRPDIRNNARLIADRPEWAAELWGPLAPHMPPLAGLVAVGLNERLRFYRYDPGEKFAPHLDGYYERPDRMERSVWTFMIYLNDDFVGGETNLLDNDVVVRPRTGMALAFMHRQLHEGASVIEGRKYVLRTDVMYRRDPPTEWAF